MIGATYTVSPTISPSIPMSCNKAGCVAAKKGAYRCDTFIKDAYITAGVPGLAYSALDTPSSLWSNPKFNQ